MTAPRVSIVVVSRHRAALLRRCVIGLSQLLYDEYEIVVVADPDGIKALDDFDGRIKTILFDEPNISAARNLGIASASGPVIAFIDDDAVPEPTWLARLAEGFSLENVAAVGGYVRGRNGISFQWRAGAVDKTGTRVNIPDQDMPFVPSLPEHQVTKLEGTNMAVRRDVLIALGGFDPAFQYYLDETDICLRIAAAGHALALCPKAEVHHGFAVNATRSADRAPKSLFQIGASKAVFLRKHTNLAELEPFFDQYRSSQRQRLLRYLHFGMIEPRDVGRLMQSLEDGFAHGMKRPFGSHDLMLQSTPFLAFETSATQGSVLLAGRTWQRAKLRKDAAVQRANGKIVTIFLFGPSFRRHHVRFEEPGVWVQSGGLWGRSDRTGGLVIGKGFRGRVAREYTRSKPQRALCDANP